MREINQTSSINLGKSIINPDVAVTIWNHGVYSLLKDDFYDVIVDPSIGKDLHFRENDHGDYLNGKQKEIIKVWNSKFNYFLSLTLLRVLLI